MSDAPGRERAPGGEYRRTIRRRARLHHEHMWPINIPQDVLADRERRLALSHASLTAALVGDPLPGYSAQDRKSHAG